MAGAKKEAPEKGRLLRRTGTVAYSVATDTELPLPLSVTSLINHAMEKAYLAATACSTSPMCRPIAAVLT